jgi:outer membrane protein assembly factor BamB
MFVGVTNPSSSSHLQRACLSNRIKRTIRVSLATCFAICALGVESSDAQNWANWRGPEQAGVSRETNLVDDWSFAPEKNVIWKADTGGRSTPIVLNGRVFLNCRTKDDFNDPEEKINSREQVVCWDAETGEELWRDVFNVFQTDIPSPRVGWAAMCGDEETGNVFLHSVSGLFKCYSPDGKIVWEKSLAEDFGKISGYGGRTQTPIIDEDRVIVSYLATNWGDMKGPAPKHYYYAFDKKTGDLLWIAAPGGAPKDTNYSAPIVAVIKGQRMLIAGNADGNIYAMNARTGKSIWGFKLSLRGLNTTPAIEGDYVYISHGEDNVDNTEFGRVQCIDATGSGDVTETHSVWRKDGIKAGYTALIAKDGVLYVIADLGNMHAFDSKSGEELWVKDLGTVGKGSPVWADGKIYATEVNGNVHIVKPTRESCETLSHVKITAANEGIGMDEIYASPAIANGRVYIVTRDRTICIGDKEKKVEIGSITELPAETASTDVIDSIQLRPYEVLLTDGEKAEYEVVAFDANGNQIKSMPATDIQLGPGLEGLTVDGNTVSAPAGSEANLAGKISVTVDGKEASARIRAFSAAKEWKWDFDGLKGVAVPNTWSRAHIKIKPTDLDGNVAMKVTGGPQAKGRPSHLITIGPADMKGYTVQADGMMKEQRRQLGSVGVSNQRYTLIIKGNSGQLQIRSWQPHLRMAKSMKFRADPDVWYSMKIKVDVVDGVAKIFGKAWDRTKPEPEEWTIEATDPHANDIGAPGIWFFAQADCFFDNVIVTK